MAISLRQIRKNFFQFEYGQIDPEDLAVFSRLLATMIDAGMPLVQALGTLYEQTDSRNLKNAIFTVQQDIKAGMNFSDALAKHPKVFSEFFVNMVKAGEISGRLKAILGILAEDQEKFAALLRKVRSHLTYKKTVFWIAVLLSVVTSVVLSRSFLSVINFFIFWGLSIIAIFLITRYLNTKKGRYNFDYFCLKIPFLGALGRNLALARFSRTFSSLMKSGVPVMTALDVASRTSGNKLVEEAVLNCRSAVGRGESLLQALSENELFPPLFFQMIAVGEEAGELPKILTKVADYYEEQIEAIVAISDKMRI